MTTLIQTTAVKPRTAPLALDAGLIAKYSTQGPRYTSYPTALQFTDQFTADDY